MSYIPALGFSEEGSPCVVQASLQLIVLLGRVLLQAWTSIPMVAMATGLLLVPQIPQRDPWLHEGCGAGPPEEISERGASFPARQETPSPTGVTHKLWVGRGGGATSCGWSKRGGRCHKLWAGQARREVPQVLGGVSGEGGILASAFWVSCLPHSPL